MSAPNNRGYFLRAVEENNAPLPAGRYLEVFQTDENGKPDGDPVVSCFVAECETDEEAVGLLLAEYLHAILNSPAPFPLSIHPFGAAWDSPEQYGTALDAVKWLAEFHGIQPEDVK